MQARGRFMRPRACFAAYRRDTPGMPHRPTVLAAALVATASLCGAAIADDSLPGPHPVSQRTVTVTRTNGSTFTAQIRYPAQSTAANAPFALARRAETKAIIIYLVFMGPRSHFKYKRCRER